MNLNHVLDLRVCNTYDMEVLENNIYPIFDRMLGREDKEALLGQRGVMVWFTGLKWLGEKTTIAIALET